MMNKLRIKQSVSAFLLIVMLLGCFAGCDGTQNVPDDTTDSSEVPSAEDTTVTEETETGDEPVSGVLQLAKGKKTEFVVTFSNKASDSIRVAAQDLVSDFYTTTKAKTSLNEEYANSKNEDMPTYEIIVGQSNREDFADLYAGLRYKEYAIEVRGTKILIAGYDDLTLLDAIDYFYKNILNSQEPTIATDYSYRRAPVYTATSIKLDGKDISEWRLVYSTAMGGTLQRETAIDDFRAYVGEVYGKMPTVEKYKASADPTGCIIVGGTPKHANQTINYGDCKVYAEDGTIYVDATDIVGLSAGVSYLASLLIADDEVSLQSKDISYSESLVDRSVYLNDPTKFNVCFGHAYKQTDEQLTLAYKIKLLNDPTGETVIMAHRSFHTYYPEESLEALIAAWRLGCVATEYDLHITKDGVPVALHDDTLNRVTNVDYMQSIDDTLPTSDNVADWTYAELLKLRLVNDFGEVTPFQISTLEEGLKACDGRILFFYEFKTGNENTYLWPAAERLGIYSCIFPSTSSIASSQNYRNKYASKGVILQTLTRSSSTSKTMDMLSSMVLLNPGTITPLLVPLGDYDKWTKADISVIQPYLEDVRIGAWFLRTFDTPYNWHEGQKKGIDLMFTDTPLPILRHIRANYAD